MFNLGHFQFPFDFPRFKAELLSFPQLFLQFFHLNLQFINLHILIFYLGLVSIALISTFLLNSVDKRFIGLKLVAIKIGFIFPFLLSLFQPTAFLPALLQIILQFVILHLQSLVLLGQASQLINQLFGVGVVNRVQMLLHLVEFSHFGYVVSRYYWGYLISSSILRHSLTKFL